MTAPEVISVANAEVGYLEKKSNAQLDSKTANAGQNNYTKYARDYAKWTGVNNQGQPWCGMFMLWIFVIAFGLSKAKSLLCGIATAYTPTFAQQFKNAGRWKTKDPKPGDVIFFKNSTRICHVGLVEKVVSGMVYTIEGNTSSANGTVVPNGGGVFKKSYKLTHSRIAGYGRPAYDNIQNVSDSEQKADENGHIPINYKVGTVYTLQQDMNVRTKLSSEDPSCLPNATKVGTRPKGSKVTCQATTLVSGKIWMYIGLDGGKRENWICADSGKISYIK